MFDTAKAGRVLFLVSLLFLFTSSIGLAASHRQVASKTGLDSDLFSVLSVQTADAEIAITIVYINARAFDSKISPDLRAQLIPFVTSNAFYVNPTVEQQQRSQIPFFPTQFAISQDSTTIVPKLEAWKPLTEGFLVGQLQANPWGGQGSGSEGVLLVGESIDPSRPFTISYQGQTAQFDLWSATSRSTTSSRSSLPADTGSESVTVTSSVTGQDFPMLVNLMSSEDFSAILVGNELGIEESDIGTLIADQAEQQLRLLLIPLTEHTLIDLLPADLATDTRQILDKGAIMVWILSPTGIDFSLGRFWIKQEQATYSFFGKSSFANLTAGFSDTTYIEPGKLLGGIILLPNGLDTTKPFTINYRNSGKTFQLTNSK